MVRFIIDLSQEHVFTAEAFTFQYGQIYYDVYKARDNLRKPIYIPIWLDLLYNWTEARFFSIEDLHSNMVRFIIAKQIADTTKRYTFTFQYGQIYYE